MQHRFGSPYKRWNTQRAARARASGPLGEGIGCCLCGDKGAGGRCCRACRCGCETCSQCACAGYALGTTCDCAALVGRANGSARTAQPWCSEIATGVVVGGACVAALTFEKFEYAILTDCLALVVRSGQFLKGWLECGESVWRSKRGEGGEKERCECWAHS